ncbi:biofilm regulation phosphoprotein SiaC [Bordetella sp. N]|uniref:biofilm regulation phosphoprotein SiaC n=1 Tax=Bordetella sp. N TaxID=1746199 RepID=UPI00070B99AB|nr:biofilm regulation phosphoprotein SiaC [Bordetella sp. N]ALM84997.1 hypothetical protein ASB57_20275 [Bordetella sp. N]
MNDLNIPATQSTPAIESDASRGVLVLRGDSYPENSFELFGPVIKWVDDYLANSQAPLALSLELQYLNTSSVKAVMDIFDLLEAAHADERQVSVVWFYDARNERVGELAEEFKEDCTFPFEVVSR